MGMRRGRVALACALAALAGGCRSLGPSSWHRTSDGRMLPDRWTLPAGAEADVELALRYDCLYVADPRTLNEVYQRKWYRFWPGGAVAEWNVWARDPDPGEPTASAGDDFRRSLPGRYRVVGRRIEMEFLGLTENGPTFVRVRGEVRPDGSFVSGTLGEPHVQGETYHPVPAPGMSRQPDW